MQEGMLKMNLSGYLKMIKKTFNEGKRNGDQRTVSPNKS